jgi:hypothetical protein
MTPQKPYKGRCWSVWCRNMIQNWLQRFRATCILALVEIGSLRKSKVII